MASSIPSIEGGTSRRAVQNPRCSSPARAASAASFPRVPPEAAGTARSGTCRRAWRPCCMPARELAREGNRAITYACLRARAAGGTKPPVSGSIGSRRGPRGARRRQPVGARRRVQVNNHIHVATSTLLQQPCRLQLRIGRSWDASDFRYMNVTVVKHVQH